MVLRGSDIQPLAPLDPDGYLRWIWETTDGAKGHAPSSSRWAKMLRVPVRTARRWLVQQAAWTRREQRRARICDQLGIVELTAP